MFQSHIHNDVLFLTFSDPSSKNAFSLGAAREFQSKFLEKEWKGLVLRAVGPVFCSGGQLKDYANHPEKGIEVNREITAILNEFSKRSYFKVAYVDGLCVGGGVEWVSAFDLVQCSPRSRFGLWQRNIGLTFGWGGGRRLENKIGISQTKNWLLQTSLKSAYSAQSLRLIDRVVSPHAFQRDILKRPEWSFPSWENSNRIWNWCSDEEEEVFATLWLNSHHKKQLDRYL